MAGLRQSLDDVDSGIVRLIARRREVIAAIAKVKEGGSAGIRDTERERRVLDSVEAIARDLGVSASLVRTIFRELISDSVAQQARPGRPGPRRLPGRAARVQPCRGAEIPGRAGT